MATRSGKLEGAAHAGDPPARSPRARHGDDVPPPLPPPLPAPDEAFGAADEDGLRMLAALGTLTSLEPDYSDDVAAEASVTIIEAVDSDAVIEALADPVPLTARHFERRGLPQDDPVLLLNGYETFLGPGDEAFVEIVEAPPELADDDEEDERPARPRGGQPASLAERLAAATGRGGRFFKALSGG